MSLRLAQEPTFKTCPSCGGRGRVPCQPTISVRTGVGGFNGRGAIETPGAGRPVPCPMCRGRKVVPS